MNGRPSRTTCRYSHNHSRDSRRNSDNNFRERVTQILNEIPTPKEIIILADSRRNILTQNDMGRLDGLGLEICPYIRNVLRTENETYDGTCALTKRPCLGHHAYPVGKDPHCEHYDSIWSRNANTNDLVTSMNRN